MIQLLDKQVSDKIAAGEVIDRPVSIVKELVENAIDADAGSIAIEIKSGGKSLIRVTDDGCGIAPDECETAFLRHATSKIRTAEDLTSIRSLGFRGEALASIAAVTRTTMITKRRTEDAGIRLVLHGGEVIEKTPVGCPDGTTFVVTDLFYNTPARRQFLRTNGAEAGRIIDFVQEMAVCWPDIRFRLINNGQILFATTGSDDVKTTILEVYHQKEYRGLIPISYDEGGLHIDGCISRPSLSRTTRRDQMYFVNGRVVKSRVLERGVSNGYRERLFANRYPVVFLRLTTDPSMVDVNIHPTKREVRFHDEALVSSFLENAVDQALRSEEAVVQVGDYYRKKTEPDGPQESRSSSQIRKDLQMDIRRFLAKKRKDEQQSKPSVRHGNSPAASAASPAASGAFSEEAASYTGDEPDAVLSSPEREKAGQADFDLRPPENPPFDIGSLTIHGVVFDTYLVCTDRDSLILVDQHAAHERVFYEKLVGEYLSEKKLTQPILTPLLIDVPLSAGELDEDWLGELRGMGYELEPFGPNTLRVTGIPTFMEIGEAETFVRDFLDQVESGGSRRNQVVIDKLITRSCKSAVKAHDRLSEEETAALLSQLKECRNPFSCPHGRPTFIRFRQTEIERFFKR